MANDDKLLTAEQKHALVLKSWRDEQFRQSLPDEVREALPPPPEGIEEMTDEQLEAAAGGVSAISCAVGIAVVSTAAGYGVSEWAD